MGIVRMGIMVLVVVLCALATRASAAEGCPFSRRNLLQAPAPAPVAVPSGRPKGPEVFEQVPLDYDFYTVSCTKFETIVGEKVKNATAFDSLAPAFLLRLFFHDCFVQGCDASLLLKSTIKNLAEMDEERNDTLEMFGLIDEIKTDLEAACNGTVSCADILAAVAVEAVFQSGGPRIYLAYGRRDGLDSFAAAAQTNMPGGFRKVQGLIENFANQGLNVTDLVALSGAHTIGQAHCDAFEETRFSGKGINPFRDRVYGQAIEAYCQQRKAQGLKPRVALDANTTTIFDNGYFQSLKDGRGILVSDQDLFDDPLTKPLVELFARDEKAFFAAFAESMRKMSKIGVLTGTQGQVRRQCGVRNTVPQMNQNSNFDFDPISGIFCKPITPPQECRLD